MAVVTIGEYSDSKDAQRDCIRWETLDLSDGSAVSQEFDQQTKSIRVCSDVPHRFVIGAGAEPHEDGQRRPAEAVESHNVAQGQSWRISFSVEE